MALLHFPGPRLQAASGLCVVGGRSEHGCKSLALAGHVGVGNDPHLLFLHCRSTVRRVVERQKLAVAVYDVQELGNEGGGNFEPRTQKYGGAGDGNWNDRSNRSNGSERGRGRGRGRGNGGRGGGAGRGGRGGGGPDSFTRRQGGERELISGSSFSRGEREEDSYRPSSSSDRGPERGDFEGRGGYGGGNEGCRGGYGGRNESRGESRTSISTRGGYAERNGPSGKGRSDSREENGRSSGSSRGGYSRGSFGRGRGTRGDSGSIDNYAGRSSSRAAPVQESYDKYFDGYSAERQGESRGRENFSGSVSEGDISRHDGKFRVNLPERSESRGGSRQSSFGRGSFAQRNGPRETKEPWELFEERSKSGKGKGPSPTFQIVTPKQSTSQFVSDRAVYKAPWEQGKDAEPVSRSFGERDFTKRNPLIERLASTPAVKDGFEEETDEGKEADDTQATHFISRGEKSAMSRIVEKLSNIPGSRKAYEPRSKDSGNIFVPKAAQPLFPMVQKGWSTPDHPVPTPAEVPRTQRPDTRFPWEREDDELRMQEDSVEKQRRVKPPSLAELTIPEDELKRLRSLGILARHRIKIGKAGVTNGIVEAIHNEWRDSEIVRVKCEGAPAMNMKRTHQELEEKSGGLVIWRAGGACLIYRGKDYVPPPLRGLLGSESSEESEYTDEVETVDDGEDIFAADDESETEGEIVDKKENSVVVVPKVRSVYDPEMERELEEILSALGPLYDDWTGGKPVPVDADQLITEEFKFKKPYRLLPYGVKPALSNTEMTELRRLARPIPPHFVLGRNRGLDGLAAAIVKLWERSEIAKIAVKRGVQNTNHERMGEELKRLTGGVLLARDKYFIVLYRGKDFLPPSVAAALAERQAMTQALQEEEEKVRMVPRSTTVLDTAEGVTAAVAGTLTETLQAKANWEVLKDSDEERMSREKARQAAKKDLTRRIERKLAITIAKKQRAELELEKVEKRLRPAGPPVDRELITEEEMHMYLKLGLKMKAFLLLGRRGVFDGTIENMHLHWKHRELVKIIYKARNKLDLEQTAKMLEYESGGILVGTLPTSKGQAIIVYRGKNYSRPPELRPRSLLTKRQALKRSIELQRQEALERHMLALEKEIEFMQADLNKLGADDGEGTDAAALPSSDFEGNDIDFQFTGVGDMSLTTDKGVGYLSKRGRLDPIFRADTLSRKEKLILRQKALNARKAAHFNVGGSNVVAGLARAIRIHFQKHAVVKVGVKGRAKGTPVEEIIRQLEDATGGTLVSQEASKIILYRGWPEGEERPKQDLEHDEDDIPPELRNAMMTEEGMDEDLFEEEEEDSEWDEDDNELSMKTVGRLDFEDDSDWDDDEDLEEEEDDNDEGVVSQWQEGGSVSRLHDGADQPTSVDVPSSDTADFEYEEDADTDDVDFEWNEVEDEVSSDVDVDSQRTDVSESRTQM